MILIRQVLPAPSQIDFWSCFVTVPQLVSFFNFIDDWASSFTTPVDLDQPLTFGVTLAGNPTLILNDYTLVKNKVNKRTTCWLCQYQSICKARAVNIEISFII